MSAMCWRICPDVLDPRAPEVRRMNLPIGWAGAFDVLQLEDYEWVTGGATRLSADARAEAGARLGYALAEQHYFAGFAATPADWPRIVAAAEAIGGGVAPSSGRCRK